MKTAGRSKSSSSTLGLDYGPLLKFYQLCYNAHVTCREVPRTPGTLYGITTTVHDFGLVIVSLKLVTVGQALTEGAHCLCPSREVCIGRNKAHAEDRIRELYCSHVS